MYSTVAINKNQGLDPDLTPVKMSITAPLYPLILYNSTFGSQFANSTTGIPEYCTVVQTYHPLEVYEYEYSYI